MNGHEKSDELLSCYNIRDCETVKCEKDCIPNLFKVTKTNEYILYASSHDEFIGHPIDILLGKRR